MNQLSTTQLAELLIGIARSQQAIVDAVESLKPGFKASHLAPVLESTAKLRATGRPLSLLELPARVLVQCQGRTGPNLEQLKRDLDALLANEGSAPEEEQRTAARAPADKSAPDSLDMT
jgi:hypothetical protein